MLSNSVDMIGLETFFSRFSLSSQLDRLDKITVREKLIVFYFIFSFVCCLSLCWAVRRLGVGRRGTVDLDGSIHLRPVSLSLTGIAGTHVMTSLYGAVDFD